MGLFIDNGSVDRGISFIVEKRDSKCRRLILQKNLKATLSCASKQEIKFIVEK